MKHRINKQSRAWSMIQALGALVASSCLLSGTLSATDEVIVDNHEPGFTASANWGTDRARDQFGPDFRWRQVQAISDPARWTGNLPVAGTWRVEAWWPTVGGAGNATYTLNGKTISVDQSVNGGQWNTLGTFTMAAGDQTVSLSAWSSGNRIVLADAIRWVRIPTTPTVVTIDNHQPGFSASANWGTGQAPDQAGPDYRWRLTGAVTDPASWNPNLPTAGNWRVEAWWPMVHGAGNAAYVIAHSGGTTTVMRNQAIGAGQWNSLGTFHFGPGAGTVQLSAWGDGTSIVLADAIRWVKQ